MKAYSQGITKEEFVNEMKKHQMQDNFVRGTYGKINDSGVFRGCAIGCGIRSISDLKGTALDTSNHSLYEKHLGIPKWLARLEDRIFETISSDRVKLWPVQFAEAINEGADLSLALYPFLIVICKSVLNDFDHLKNPNVKKSIDDIIDALSRGEKNIDTLRALRKAAAAYAAAAAAYAAADARTNRMGFLADELLNILRNTK